MSDLEDARSDLHETNCKDRSVIHELTFNNRQLQLTEASLRDRLTAADEQLRQLHNDLDSAVHRATQLEASLQRARDTERRLTERCGEMEAEMADWKCRLDDALQLVESKEGELRHADAEHLMEMDRWSQKVEELMAANSSLEASKRLVTANSSLEASEGLVTVNSSLEASEELVTSNSRLEASEAGTRRDVMEAELRENLLRKNMEELNKQLSHQEISAAETKDQMNDQLSALKERLFQLESCLESKELQLAELEKSYDGAQSVRRQIEEEKSQLLITLTDVRKERNDGRDEVKSLNETLASLQDRLLSSSNKCTVLEEWLGEVNSKNDAAEQVWKSRVETVEAEKRQLQNRIVDLETDVSLLFLLSDDSLKIR